MNDILNKRIAILFVAVLCVFAVMVTICSPYGVGFASADFFVIESSNFDGSGTDNDPYKIKSKEDMEKLSSYVGDVEKRSAYADKSYILTADIDMGGVYNPDSMESGGWSGVSFLPIGWNEANCFKGKFDGNGFEIRNIYISNAKSYCGVFGWCQGATIKNVCVSSGFISGLQYVGAIAGALYGGSVVESSCNKAIVNATGSYAGGITGFVDGTDNGLKSIVRNCYNAGMVACSKAVIVGGIVGGNDGEVTECYNIGGVSASSTHGAIVGKNYFNRTTKVIVRNTYYNKDTLIITAASAPTSAVGYSIRTEEDNKLSASKMVTLYAQAQPMGMMGLTSEFWVFSKPANDIDTKHYYPQLKGLKKIPAISVTVLPGVYNVEFNLNGSKNTPPKTQNIRDGEFAVEPTRPQRNGYSFSHWSLDRTNKNGKFIFNTTQITENIILYAIWVFNDAKVVVSASKTEAVYGEVITLTANVEHGASNIEYTWYKTNNNNPLGKDKTLTISNVAESGKYYCRVIVTDETESGKNTATAKSNELDVRILQAIDPTYVLPKITPVFYFPGITLNHITLDLGYKWSNGSTALYATTDAGNKYNFVFTPLDTSNYKTITDKAVVIVKKANYDNITHIPLTTTYKECLKLSDLSNSLNGCFRWENTEQLVFAGKEQRFDALYNADENNYNDFKLTIIVTVDRAQSIVHPYYKGKLYANVDMDLVVFALKDGDTSGICSLRAGQVAVVGVESTYDWAFTPTDKNNYYNAIGKVKLFVYAVNLESIIISSQPTKMSYLAFEQFNTEGMIVSKVFNNGVIEQTFDYRIEYVNNPIGVNWFLCDSPSINTVYRDIKIVLSTNIEFIVILSNIQVTKASYVPEEVAHTPINIQYFDLIMLNDLQKKLKENYLFYAVNSIHAGDGQSYKAKYNRDKANYFDIDVMVTVNISKATYSNKIHNTLTTTYEIGLTLSKLQLKENYFWNVPKQLLNAGENQQFQAYYNADEINYENFPLSITVNVKKAQYILTNITFANKEFCYDRQPHDIKIDGVLPDGISVSYVGNGAVRAGLYTVIANFVMDKPENYESVKSMQANMLITKKNITVDFTTDFDGEFIANNEIDINTITNGVLDDDSVTIKIQILKDGKIVATGDNSMSMIFEAGYYTICTSLYNSENYNLISVTERYFVVKAASIDSENIEGQPPQVILSVNNGIDPNATLVVQTIDISKTEHDINQSLAKKLGNYVVKQVYGIKLMDTSSPTEIILNGKAQMKIRIPTELSEIAKKLKIVFVNENNEITAIDSIVVDNYLIFDIEHLSNYAIVSETDKPIVIDPEKPPIDDKPIKPITPTAPSIWLLIGIIAVILMGCTLTTWLLAIKKR